MRESATVARCDPTIIVSIGFALNDKALSGHTVRLYPRLSSCPVELTNMVKVIEGKKVYVRFSEPCAVQIDGETILNVREYRAEA